MTNIREFRPPNPASIWCARWYAVIMYLFIGWQMIGLTTGNLKDISTWHVFGPTEDKVNLLFLLSILYWAFIQARIHTTRRFKESIVLVVILAALILFVYHDIALWLAGLCVLYWLMIAKTRGNTYFLRYHLLSALILGFTLLLPFLITSDAVQCAIHLLAAFGLAALSMPLAAGLTLVYPLAGLVLCGGSYVYMAFGALFGASPKLPFVTRNVQYMA